MNLSRSILCVAALFLACQQTRAQSEIGLINSAGKGKDKGEKVDRPKKDANPDVVDSLTKGFQEKAEDYQLRQKELLEALRKAKGEEKDKLRDALKALQNTIREEKENFKDQVKEARDKLGDLKTKLEEEAKEAREKTKARDR